MLSAAQRLKHAPRSRAIGGRVNQFPNLETAKKVGIDYTLTAAKAFASGVAPLLPAGQAFRFVFCSGAYTEWDQTKFLAFLGDSRRIKVRLPSPRLLS
jgi:hypothetical protein